MSTLEAAVDQAWCDAHRGMGPVLIVDDSDTVRAAVRMLLERRGYEVCEAASGAGAVEMAQLWMPRVVLLDLDLPDTEGWQVLEQLRRLRACLGTTIILFSARTDTETRERAHRLGTPMLEKPASGERILSEVQRHVRAEESLYRAAASRPDQPDHHAREA